MANALSKDLRRIVHRDPQQHRPEDEQVQFCGASEASEHENEQ